MEYRHPRILVVDDHEDTAEVMRLLLGELWECEVAVAREGPSALVVAGDFHPDVVLLDIDLPGMSGYEVARRLRRLAGLERITLIALTGWDEPEDRCRWREAGFDHFLLKPLDPTALQPFLGPPR